MVPGKRQISERMQMLELFGLIISGQNNNERQVKEILLATYIIPSPAVQDSCWSE